MDTQGLGDRIRTGTGFTGPKAGYGKARVSLALVCMAAGLLLLPGIEDRNRAWAGSLSRSITITAQVLPFVKLTNLRQQENLVISETDARRGLVEISDGSLIEIKNNITSGCYLVVEVNGFPYEWASVNVQGRPVTLAENGGIIHWPSRGSVVTPVHYVIALKPGTKPGVYPWPFRLTASAVQAF